MTARPDRPFVLAEAEAPPPSTPFDRPLVIETEDRTPIAPMVSVPRAGLEVPALLTPPRIGGLAALGLAGLGLGGLLLVLAVDWVAGLVSDDSVLAIPAAVSLAAMLGGAAAWGLREARSLMRLRSVATLQARLDRAHLPESRQELRRLLDATAGRMARIPGYAPMIADWRARARVEHPPADALRLFESAVLAAADAQALAAVRRAARDTFGLVALSPTALTDSALFVSRALRMLREVAEAYGHRPGRLAMLMLARRVLREVGLITVADLGGDAVSAFFGGKLLEKVSTAAAEGAIAAQRMARLGLLAVDCCRPLRFADDRRPSLTALLA